MVYKINKNKIDENVLEKAVDILRSGGVIIYPTDTAYGLGCDATNEMAVEKIYKIKQRTKAKSMPVIAGSFSMAEKYFIFLEKEKELATKFWLNTPLAPRPSGVFGRALKGGTAGKGKLSIVLKVKKNIKIAKSVMAEDGTAAVRVPDSLWACALSLKLGKLIVSTSANLAGVDSCYSIGGIKKTGVDFNDINIILDGGILPRVMPSTIVKVKDGKVKILRKGSVGIVDL